MDFVQSLHAPESIRKYLEHVVGGYDCLDTLNDVYPVNQNLDFKGIIWEGIVLQVFGGRGSATVITK